MCLEDEAVICPAGRAPGKAGLSACFEAARRLRMRSAEVDAVDEEESMVGYLRRGNEALGS